MVEKKEKRSEDKYDDIEMSNVEDMDNVEEMDECELKNRWRPANMNVNNEDDTEMKAIKQCKTEDSGNNPENLTNL